MTSLSTADGNCSPVSPVLLAIWTMGIRLVDSDAFFCDIRLTIFIIHLFVCDPFALKFNNTIEVKLPIPRPVPFFLSFLDHLPHFGPPLSPLSAGGLA